MEPNEVLELLAEIEHNQWVDWSKKIAKTEKISDDRLIRWKSTWKPYAELTDEEKEKDREWARVVLRTLQFYINKNLEEK